MLTTSNEVETDAKIKDAGSGNAVDDSRQQYY